MIYKFETSRKAEEVFKGLKNATFLKELSFYAWNERYYSFYSTSDWKVVFELKKDDVIEFAIFSDYPIHLKNMELLDDLKEIFGKVDEFLKKATKEDKNEKLYHGN